MYKNLSKLYLFFSFCFLLQFRTTDTYKENFQQAFYDLDIAPIEHSSSDLKFNLRLSKARQEHLCKIELHLEEGLLTFKLLESPHNDVIQNFPELPLASEFTRPFYRELFAFSLKDVDSFAYQFVFFENVVAFVKQNIEWTVKNVTYSYALEKGIYYLIVKDQEINQFVVSFFWMSKYGSFTKLHYNFAWSNYGDNYLEQE